MKGYDLKTVLVDPVQSKIKDKNPKGQSRSHVKSNSQKKYLSPDKRLVKNAMSNENIKKSIFSQLGNNIVHSNETSSYDMFKDFSNKENELELRKNSLNYSADKSDYSNSFNPLNKLRNANNNYSNPKVQSYLYSNKNNNGNSSGSADILLNGYNIVPVNQNDSCTESVKYIIEEVHLSKYINICDIWLDLHNVLLL